jgi:hypothetical protein
MINSWSRDNWRLRFQRTFSLYRNNLCQKKQAIFGGAQNQMFDGNTLANSASCSPRPSVLIIAHIFSMKDDSTSLQRGEVGRGDKWGMNFPAFSPTPALPRWGRGPLCLCNILIVNNFILGENVGNDKLAKDGGLLAKNIIECEAYMGVVQNQIFYGNTLANQAFCSPRPSVGEGLGEREKA